MSQQGHERAAGDAPTGVDDDELMRYLQTRPQKRLSITPHDMRILVIDDEKVSRIVIQRLLEKSGYRNVISVESAQEGLKEMRKGNINMVLCDVKMPGMNGLEFLEKLVEDPSYRFDLIPVIMVSAVDELQLVYQCLNMGASDFLTKPIRQETVENLWRTIWRKRKDTELRKRYDDLAGQREKEVEELQEQMAEAIKTPVRAITEAINGLMNERNLTDEVKSTLGQILKSIHSSNLYRPVLDDLVVSEENREIDAQTRQWLTSELQIGSRTASLPDAVSLKPPTSEDIEKLRSWEFDVWKIADDFTLFAHIQTMFDDFSLLNTFKIPAEKFRKFLLSTRKLYHDKNPYHNFRHAFDVTHMIYLMLTKANAAKFLGSLEVLAVLLAGLLHDIDHPGLNNNFQITTSSNLALTYNDHSVLENHHCSTAFKLLYDAGMFDHVELDTRRKIRKLIINIILATDLSNHVSSLSSFDSMLDSGIVLDKDNEEHRAVVATMLMRAADLSNPAKPFPIAKYWAHMVQEEFFLQGDKEAEKGIKVSPFMTRGNSSLPQMQMNFADFIVIPMFKIMTKLLPVLESAVMRHLLENRALWAEYLKAEKESQAQQPM